MKNTILYFLLLSSFLCCTKNHNINGLSIEINLDSDPEQESSTLLYPGSEFLLIIKARDSDRIQDIYIDIDEFNLHEHFENIKKKTWNYRMNISIPETINAGIYEIKVLLKDAIGNDKSKTFTIKIN